jgi:hypothetical protein
MAKSVCEIKLEITPEPPDTVDSVRAELVPLIRDSLTEHGRQEAITDIVVTMERTFPVDEAILVAISFLSKVAYDVWKTVVLPRIQNRWSVREREQKKPD